MYHVYNVYHVIFYVKPLPLNEISHPFPHKTNIFFSGMHRVHKHPQMKTICFWCPVHLWKVCLLHVCCVRAHVCCVRAHVCCVRAHAMLYWLFCLLYVLHSTSTQYITGHLVWCSHAIDSCMSKINILLLR